MVLFNNLFSFLLPLLCACSNGIYLLDLLFVFLLLFHCVILLKLGGVYPSCSILFHQYFPYLLDLLSAFLASLHLSNCLWLGKLYSESVFSIWLFPPFSLYTLLFFFHKWRALLTITRKSSLRPLVSKLINVTLGCFIDFHVLIGTLESSLWEKRHWKIWCLRDNCLLG